MRSNAEYTAAVATRFQRETADHTMTVLHEDGLYRHLRFAKKGSSFYWFDLVTFPGRLVIDGDMGTFAFARIEDMFAFFRAEAGWNHNSINPQYWAEKVRGSTSEITVYSEDKLRQLVVEHFVDVVKGGGAPAGLGLAVREEILDSGELDYEDSAMQVLRDFEFKGFSFSDTWEWSVRDYSVFYLWCCHAIQWGIGQYDAAKAAPVQAEQVAAVPA